ncbi:hypothetical protein AtNW77_Chr1g0036531 [Arabidopsis thaliana]|jgi:hypothetical protein|uniref:At1g32630 n=4 Tax=Arabidopsis TaxID=3701 RepID=Q9LPJ9_ARATH|nr:FAM50A-like protein [Arabidopsis thaliana]NP_174540.1 FAM50A-like protein [Arabidopsis thaliana]KAG7648283.1 hypothetical protein ISN45_At01g032450 [Arabidopsis thaliana x Arabidopsis arenosa]KAG7656204.1 hypothetical protein ISN44_As01g032070 [Arabidopsis suecica]AAF25965.1 F6N18.3 [Arabidopsis thaliana]AAS49082.1 At1g32630 [Arabidopsis thaliana]AEE31512.1 FAM50A-like protein [Arabidopsis thaliana]|eukprot:NP_001322452.1 FAM50A-like protein [Arabidopsis thaliana]
MSNGGLSIDEKEGLIDKDEVMIRRMKNRERQRRYRARKRMREEEAGNDDNLSFETMGKQEEEEEEDEGLEFNGPSGYVENFVRRVYCDRNWKKEARRAHLIMNKAQDSSCESVKRKIRPHRRDWKAEARKKKT